VLGQKGVILVLVRVLLAPHEQHVLQVMAQSLRDPALFKLKRDGTVLATAFLPSPHPLKLP